MRVCDGSEAETIKAELFLGKMIWDKMMNRPCGAIFFQKIICASLRVGEKEDGEFIRRWTRINADTDRGFRQNGRLQKIK
jgi:hypothetical protein